MSITALPRPVVGAPTDLLSAAVPGTGGGDFAALLAAMVAGPTPGTAAGPASDQVTDAEGAEGADGTDDAELGELGELGAATSVDGTPPVLLVQEWASAAAEPPVTARPVTGGTGDTEPRWSAPVVGDRPTTITSVSSAPRSQPGAVPVSPLTTAPLVDDPTPIATPTDVPAQAPAPTPAPDAAPDAVPLALPLTRPDLAARTDPAPPLQTVPTPAPLGAAADGGTSDGVPVGALLSATTPVGARPPELLGVPAPVATTRPGTADSEHPTPGEVVLRPLTGPLAALLTGADGGTTSDPGSGNDDPGAVDVDPGVVPAPAPRLDGAAPPARLDPTTPGVVAGPAAREVVDHVEQLASQGGGTRQVTLRLDAGSGAEVRVHLSLSDGALRVRLVTGEQHSETLQLGAAGLQALLRTTGVDDVRVEVSGTATTADQPGDDHGSDQSTPQDSSRADTLGPEWSGPRSGRERTPAGTWDVTSAMDGTQARAPRPRPVEPSTSSPHSGVDVLA